MREKKYANILEEDTEKETNIEDVIAMLDETKELSKESFDEFDEKIKEADKLSMTREIKFKDIQEQIENDEKAITREIVIEPPKKKTSSKKVTSPKKEEPKEEPKPEPKKTKKTTRKKQELEEPPKEEVIQDDDVTITKIDMKKLNELEDVDVDKDLEKTINDDLYLTTAFKPAKKRVKKIVKKVLAFIIIIGLIVALTFFVLLPIYQKHNISSKDIFIKNIDNIISKINNVQYDLMDINNNIHELSFNVDTNDDNLKFLNSYQIKSKLEQDSANNTTVLSTNIEKNNEKAGLTYYSIDDDLYMNITDSKRIISLDSSKYPEITTMIASYSSTYNQIEQLTKVINPNDAKYILTKYLEVYKNNINEDDITKHKEKLTINNKEISVTRHTHELNKEKALALDNAIYNALINDDKCLKIFSSIYDKTGTELKEELKNDIINNEYEDNYTQKINIYVKNTDDFIGIDIEKSGFREFYYYTIDDYFDFLIDASDIFNNALNNSDSLSEESTEKDSKQIFQITKSLENNRRKVVIQYNGKELIKLYIDSLTTNELIADYELNIKDNIYSGKVNMHFMNNEINLDMTLNYQNHYYDIKVIYNGSYKKEINLFNEEEITKGTDEVTTEEFNLLLENLADMDFDYESLSKNFFGEDEYGELEVPMEDASTVDNTEEVTQE